MQLPIETWMGTAHLSLESSTALREAVVCYKGGGYRAGLLFSYLAFSLTLRNRILHVQGNPPGFAPGEWTSMRNDLMSEDKWDKRVFDAVQTIKSGKIVFSVSDDLRQQVKYWKDRRNDCAHFKDNEICSSHVEALWTFLRSNLGKFVPVGSEESVLQRIVTHFDPNITPPGLDPMPIVRDIPCSVESSDFSNFLTELKKAVRQKNLWATGGSGRPPRA